MIDRCTQGPLSSLRLCLQYSVSTPARSNRKVRYEQTTNPTKQYNLLKCTPCRIRKQAVLSFSMELNDSANMTLTIHPRNVSVALTILTSSIVGPNYEKSKTKDGPNGTRRSLSRLSSMTSAI